MEPPSPPMQTMGPPPRPMQNMELLSRPTQMEDESEFITHMHFHDPNMSQLEMALGIFADNTGMSRTEWAALRQILTLVDHPMIQRLPHSLTTLKRHLSRELPLLPMRKRVFHLLQRRSQQRRHFESQSKLKEILQWKIFTSSTQHISIRPLCLPTLLPTCTQEWPNTTIFQPSCTILLAGHPRSEQPQAALHITLIAVRSSHRTSSSTNV